MIPENMYSTERAVSMCALLTISTATRLHARMTSATPLAMLAAILGFSLPPTDLEKLTTESMYSFIGAERMLSVITPRYIRPAYRRAATPNPPNAARPMSMGPAFTISAVTAATARITSATP